MPRSNRPRRRGHDVGHGPGHGAGPAEESRLDPDRVLAGLERGEERAGRSWRVRAVGGAAKAYRCPGCDQEIAPGTPHVVVWPADPIGFGGLEDRRHWHTSCWRSGRRPTRR